MKERLCFFFLQNIDRESRTPRRFSIRFSATLFRPFRFHASTNAAFSFKSIFRKGQRPNYGRLFFSRHQNRLVFGEIKVNVARLFRNYSDNVDDIFKTEAFSTIYSDVII